MAAVTQNKSVEFSENGNQNRISKQLLTFTRTFDKNTMKELGCIKRLTHPLYIIPGVLICVWCLSLMFVTVPSTAVGIVFLIITMVLLITLGFIFILYCLGMQSYKSKVNCETKPIDQSTISPLLIDTMHVGSGSISMSFAPGRKSKHESRSLNDDLETLRREGVDTVVSLLEEWELSRSTSGATEEGCPDSFGVAVEGKSMKWIHFSIRDKWVPSITCDFISKVVDPVVKLVRDGKHVHVHCHGGKGRTGTLVAAVLLSLNPEEGLSQSVKLMRECRTGMLKNPLHHWYLHWLLFHGLLCKSKTGDEYP